MYRDQDVLEQDDVEMVVQEKFRLIFPKFLLHHYYILLRIITNHYYILFLRIHYRLLQNFHVLLHFHYYVVLHIITKQFLRSITPLHHYYTSSLLLLF